MNKLKLALLLTLGLVLGGCGSVDEQLLDEVVTTNSNPLELEIFMNDYNVELTHKDVQYDMVNNLEKEFAMIGTLSLCDYYNYGYTNTKDTFCGKLTPHNSKESETWYLYFLRDTFDPLYQELKHEDKYARIVAIIPPQVYQDGQGNMAYVLSVEH